MNISLIQTSLAWEDAAANRSMFTDKINAITDPADIIVLPEMFTTGFSMNTSLAEKMDGETIAWMKSTAQEKNVVLCGSVLIEDDGSFYNRLLWVQPDGSVKHYDKRHLFSLSTEPQTFSPGHEQLIVDYKGWRINLIVCYDLRFPVWIRNTKSDAYDILICVANWPERRNTAWQTLLRARAIENQAYVIGVNRVGNDGSNIYHSGDSAAIDPLGEYLYHKAHDEDTITVSLQRDKLLQIRQQLPFLNDADSFSLL
jgi:predicted amidohydrolase